MIDPTTWTPDELARHSVNPRQFIDFRQSTLPNGMRLIDVYNASGLTFTILPDRGLDIWTAHYNGLPLTWISQGSPHPPDFGQTWLQQMNGGLLTTCGLMHAGAPEVDDQTGVQRDFHGRINRMRAERIAVGDIETSGGEMSLSLFGRVPQSGLYAEQLVLERTFTVVLGKPGLYIEDRVTNLGDQPTPFMILYHFNFGFPLIAEGTRLQTPHEQVYPIDAHARTLLDTWAEYHGATPKIREAVFLHHLKAMHEKTEVLLYRDDFGLAMRWPTDELPYLTQWKNTRQGIYVCGVEPGNCVPEGQNKARQRGRLVMLEPGESRVFQIQLDVLPDAEAVQASRDQIARIQQEGSPVAGCQLGDFA
ncbi:MAG: aldose 1-epimerase family protein [Anaerolineae bacterium]|nr:aldose 1-epimerase family protein [Anaerolineae bacterium]